MSRPVARPLATAAALTLIVGLTACSAGAPSGSETPGAAPAAAPTTARIDIDTPVQSIDPTANTFLADNTIASLVNSSLFAFERGSATETVPVLAESATPSDDRTSWEITLKPDLTFSDGTPLDAEAVAGSFERLQSAEGPNAGDISMVESVSVVDPVTLTFALNRADANLPQYLAVPSTAIVPPAAADDYEYFAGDAPAYSGAFVPEGEVTANSFSLVRNDAYGGPESALERIDVSIVSDAVTSTTRLQGGETDWTATVPREQASQVTGNAVAIAMPQVSTMYLLPNNREGQLFSDVRLRQALAWAIDREALGTLAYGDAVEVQSGPYPVPADYPEPVDVYPAQDLDKARELLQGTECEAGCSITASYFASSETDAGRIAAGLQQSLQPLGITVQPTPVDNAQFIQNSLDGTFDLNIAVSGAFNIPNSMLTFRSDDSQCVYVGCENDEINGALDALLAAPDEAALEEASTTVLEIFEEWTPIIPVVGAVNTYGVSTALQDVIATQPTGILWVASK